MSGILLTQYSGIFIGPVAKILGYLMEGIFFVLDKIGIPNIGLSIILFTIIIYALMRRLLLNSRNSPSCLIKGSQELQAVTGKI